MERKGFFPTFDIVEEGFSSINMVDREDEPYAPKETGKKRSGEETSSHYTDPSAPGLETVFFDNNTSKTTIIVKFKGSVDMVLCPMVLESIQRMFEALTPTFQLLHPVSVINHLHSAALDRVEAKNTLKKEKSLDLQEKLVDTREKQLKTSKSTSKKNKVSRTTKDLHTSTCIQNEILFCCPTGYCNN